VIIANKVLALLIRGRWRLTTDGGHVAE